MALFDTTFAPYVPFGSRTLSLGATGTDVAVAQAVYDLMLLTMNPPQGPMGLPVTIDGIFGPDTRQAVINIQAYFGLPADGAVGPDTYLLYGQAVPPSAPAPTYGSRELAQGASGADVTVLQNRLNCFRYGSLIGGPATGSFDSGTADAVLAFKADATANGDLGFPDNAVAGFGFFNASWIYTFAGGRNLTAGQNGFDVVFAQTLLQQLGFYAGRRHGYYDEATQAAVAAFQAASGIAVDGVVGPATFYWFGLRNPVGAPGPLGVAWPPFPPAGCLNGMDNNINLTPYVNCLNNQGFAFAMRYLGGPCFSGVRLTPAEVVALRNAGLLVGSIYVGANTVRAFSCGTQTLAQGRADAADALRLAAGVGQPPGTAIYLDLQGDQTSAVASWLAYVQGWVGAVATGGYQPGVYSSPEQLSVIRAQPWAGNALLYWVARTLASRPVSPPPCPTEQLAFAQLWQYALDIPFCGMPTIDVDSAESTLGLWD